MKRIIFLLITDLIILLLCFLQPVGYKNLKSYPQAEFDYQRGLTHVEQIKSRDDSSINPVCKTIFLDHGQKTPKVIVFLHGFTNCPAQFAQLGKIFYDQGDNVLIPRIVHHGKQDRLTNDLNYLTAQEMAAQSDEIINTADGLGDQVTVVGLSAGGIMTAWIAQNRSDVAKAVIIAPNFKYNLPLDYEFPQTDLLKRLPNHFFWWDQKTKENVAGPKYVYPGYPTHALYEVFNLAAVVENQAKFLKPAAKSIIMVTNNADVAVSNRASENVLKNWIKNGGTNITDYKFDANLQLGHDLIDPNQPYQKVNTVYPQLLKLINN